VWGDVPAKKWKPAHNIEPINSTNLFGEPPRRTVWMRHERHKHGATTPSKPLFAPCLRVIYDPQPGSIQPLKSVPHVGAARTKPHRLSTSVVRSPKILDLL